MTDNTEKEYNEAKSPFSWEKLDGLLAYKSSLVICSEMLDVSEGTLKNHIRKRYNMTFTEYSDKKLSKTKVKLVSKALEMAFTGNNTMMIFCLKNICKWKDVVETTTDGQLNVNFVNAKNNRTS